MEFSVTLTIAASAPNELEATECIRILVEDQNGLGACGKVRTFGVTGLTVEEL